MVTMTKLSVESSLKRLWTMHLVHCPTLISMKCWTWWNRCSILPRIPSTSNRIFYHLAYQTVRCKLDVPSDQFRSLVLRLLGDKDHEKIFDCVSKVEKHYRPRSFDGATAISPYCRGNRGRNSHDFPRNPEQALSCFIVVRKAISIDGVISGKEISPGRRRMERLSQPRSNEWPFLPQSEDFLA